MARLAMKAGSLWSVSVVIRPEAEAAVADFLERLFRQPASIYSDARTQATTVTVYLEKRSACSEAKRAQLAAGLTRIRSSGLDIGLGKIFTRKIRRENWAESWKRHFKPLEISRSLLIKPSWSLRRPKAGQAVVVLDPGLSFGTGQHPTTRFCLEQLVKFRRQGQPQSFLDAGTGSGILAIAAAKLGYRPVDAFDLDPVAIRVARRNSRRNGIQRKLRLTCKNLATLPFDAHRTYDVICANLADDLLRAERARLVNRLNANGRLVLAGILKAQFPAVGRAYEAAGLRLIARRNESEWASGAFRLS